MKRRHHHSDKRKLLITGLCIALVWAALLIVLIVTGKQMNDAVPETYGSIEGRFQSSVELDYEGHHYSYRDAGVTTLLLIGIDRENVTASGGYRGGGQADFLVLLVIDKANRTVTPIQIDRDAMTPVRVYGSLGNIAGYRTMQICLAQNYGKGAAANCENTVWSVSNMLLGIPIDHYVAVSMNAVPRLNDALGGVTVTIDEDLTVLDPAYTAGATVTLYGDAALRFVRARMSVSDGTNYARMRRQRAYLASARTLLYARLDEDSDFAGVLYDLLGDDLVTDLKRSGLVSEAYRITRCTAADMQLLPGTYSVNKNGFREFAPDEDGVSRMILSLCFEVNDAYRQPETAAEKE